MLRTPLLDLLGIEHPIIQAGMGTFGSGSVLAAAVSNAGAIGTIGAAKRPPQDLRDEIAAFHKLTDRRVIVNMTRPWLQLHPECLDVALAAQPRAISISSGLPGSLVSRIHDAGVLVIAVVQTVDQACLAADEGVDIVIAQGSEAGGIGGRIGGLVLVPQVVDALAPLPVVASGGITDGRGLAAVLLLGAAGANIGTRFLASVEASVSATSKQRLVDAASGESVRIEPPVAVMSAEASTVGAAAVVTLANADAGIYVDVPSSGQGVGGIRSIQTAADIVAGLVRDAEASLRQARAVVVESAAV